MKNGSWKDWALGALGIMVIGMASLLWTSQGRVDEETKHRVERVAERQERMIEDVSDIESRLRVGEQRQNGFDEELTLLRSNLSGSFLDALHSLADCE